MTVAGTTAAPAYTAALSKDIPLTAAPTLAVGAYTAELQTRVPNRHPIALTPVTYQAMANTAVVFQRIANRHALELDGAYSASTYAAAIDKDIPLTAALSFVAGAYAAALQTRAVNRYELTLTAIVHAAPAYTVAIAQRQATRRPVTPARAFPALTATAAVATRIPLAVAPALPALTSVATLSQTPALRKELRFTPDAFGFDNAGIGFDRAPFTPAPIAYPSIVSTANLAQRISARRSITVAGSYAAPTYAVTVAKRSPLTLTATYAGIAANAAMLVRAAVRSGIAAAATYTAQAATVAVLLRATNRHTLTAAPTSPAVTSTARILTRVPGRHVVTSATTYGAFASALTLAQRIANRHAITSVGAFLAIAGTVAISNRVLLTPAGAFPVLTSNALLNKRTVMQKALLADGTVTFAVAAATAVIAQRTTARLPITAAGTFPAFTDVSALVKRIAVAPQAIYPAAASVAVMQPRIPDRLPITGAEKQFPEFVGTIVMSKMESTQKVLAADRSFLASTAAATLSQRIANRYEMQASVTYPFQRHTAFLLTREPAPSVYNLEPAVTYNAMTSTAIMGRVQAMQRALNAAETHPAIIASATMQKGAAMPPEIVMGLMLVLAGHDTLRIMWMQPGLGTGILLNYEFELDGSGVWTSTMSAAAEYTIAGLQPDTPYAISVRAVTNVGRGPGSATLMTRTLPITIPSVPLDLRAMPPGGERIDLSWRLPITDGGSPITNYEIRVIGPDGVEYPVESTGNAGLAYRASGLALYQRYGFQVRAVNSMGRSDYTGIVYATPVILPAVLPRVGQRIPLLDLDRQSLILRLANRDTRLRVWWQPSDLSWYASLESPANSPAITSRKITTGTGLLDNLPDVLPGNFVCRAIDDDSAASEPARDAWRRQTHGLFYVES